MTFLGFAGVFQHIINRCPNGKKIVFDAGTYEINTPGWNVGNNAAVLVPKNCRGKGSKYMLRAPTYAARLECMCINECVYLGSSASASASSSASINASASASASARVGAIASACVLMRLEVPVLLVSLFSTLSLRSHRSCTARILVGQHNAHS